MLIILEWIIRAAPASDPALTPHVLRFVYPRWSASCHTPWASTATFLSFFEYVAPLLPISLAASSFHSSARASVFFAAPTCDGSSDRVIDSKSWTTGVVPMSSPSVINNRHLSVRGERERHGQRAIEQTWYLASRVVWSATGPGPLLRGRRGHRAAH
jgi:hypothetical protein